MIIPKDTGIEIERIAEILEAAVVKGYFLKPEEEMVGWDEYASKQNIEDLAESLRPYGCISHQHGAFRVVFIFEQGWVFKAVFDPVLAGVNMNEMEVKTRANTEDKGRFAETYLLSENLLLQKRYRRQKDLFEHYETEIRRFCARHGIYDVQESNTAFDEESFILIDFSDHETNSVYSALCMDKFRRYKGSSIPLRAMSTTTTLNVVACPSPSASAARDDRLVDWAARVHRI